MKKWSNNISMKNHERSSFTVYIDLFTVVHYLIAISKLIAFFWIQFKLFFFVILRIRYSASLRSNVECKFGYLIKMICGSKEELWYDNNNNNHIENYGVHNYYDDDENFLISSRWEIEETNIIGWIEIQISITNNILPLVIEIVIEIIVIL